MISHIRARALVSDAAAFEDARWVAMLANLFGLRRDRFTLVNLRRLTDVLRVTPASGFSRATSSTVVETFREIALKLSAGQGLGEVKGAWFKRDGAVVQSPPRAFKDLNSFPPTNFGLVDLEGYFALRGGMAANGDDDYNFGPAFGFGFNLPLGTGTLSLDYGRRIVDSYFDNNDMFSMKFAF